MQKTAFEQIILKRVQENFLQEGVAGPIVLGATADDKLVYMPLRELPSKELLGMLISFLQTKIPMIVFIAESWHQKFGEEREEMVMVSFFFGNEKKVLTAKISRPLGCSPHLGEWEDRFTEYMKIGETQGKPELN